jgi:ClpP class serine protease
MAPHDAMSGGTLIALGAHEIVLAPSAVLGPVDPQIGQQPAASVLAAVQRKTDVNKVDDETLVLADMSQKAITPVREVVTSLLTGRGMETEAAQKLASMLSEGADRRPAR